MGDSCCNKDDITTDQTCCSESKGGEICKSLDGNTSTCCLINNGEVCDKNKGICVQGCPDINNPQYYKCHGTPIPLLSSGVLCNKDEICTVDCADKIDDSKFVCAKNTCNWAGIDYTPDYLKDPKNENINYKFNGENVAQCNTKDGQNTWLQYNGDTLIAKASTHSMDKTPNPISCSFPMCVNKIQQYDTANIIRDFTKSGDFSCNSNLNCKKSLIPPNSQGGYDKLNTVCGDISNKNKIAPQLERCCKNTSDNKYTGQVCKSDEFCGYDQKCYKGFVFDSVNSHCIPSNDMSKNPQPFETCILNQDNCKGKCTSISDWRQCYCCPDWKPQCPNCPYTYRMPDHAYPFTKEELDAILKWCYKQEAELYDHILYIYIPSKVKFELNDNIPGSATYEIFYNNISGTQQIKKEDSGLPFDTSVYKFCSMSSTMDLTITLNNIPYIIHTNSKGGDWYINIKYDGKDYKATDNSTSTAFDDINAYARIGDNSVFGSSKRPGMIWIAPIDGDNRYLNPGAICPGTSIYPILPILPNTPNTPPIYKSRKRSNIILILLIVFIILCALILLIKKLR